MLLGRIQARNGRPKFAYLVAHCGFFWALPVLHRVSALHSDHLGVLSGAQGSLGLDFDCEEGLWDELV